MLLVPGAHLRESLLRVHLAVVDNLQSRRLEIAEAAVPRPAR